MGKKTKYPIDNYVDYKIDDCDMEDDIRLYRTHVVNTRKDHRCCYCGSLIKKGDDALYGTAIVDGEFCSFYHCLDCVEDQMDFGKGKIDSDEFFERFRNRYLKGFETDINKKETD